MSNPCLIVQTGGTAGARYELMRDRLSIGRADLKKSWHPDIDLAAADGGGAPWSVSRHHAEIACTREGWVLRHTAGRGGSCVNGKAVGGGPDGSAVLRNGDRLKIGDVELLFQLPAPDSPPPPPRRPAGSRVPARVAALAAGVGIAVLGTVVMAGLSPTLHARVTALPQRIVGDWTPAVCHAYVVGCHTALSARLDAQTRDLTALSTRLQAALQQAQSTQRERYGALEQHRQRRSAFEAARSAGGFPVVVAGETLVSPAVLEGRLIALAEIERSLSESASQGDSLVAALSQLHGSTMDKIFELRAQQDGLRIWAAERAAEITLGAVAATHSTIDGLLRSASAQHALAEPILLTTEGLLRR